MIGKSAAARASSSDTSRSSSGTGSLPRRSDADAVQRAQDTVGDRFGTATAADAATITSASAASAARETGQRPARARDVTQ